MKKNFMLGIIFCLSFCISIGYAKAEEERFINVNYDSQELENVMYKNRDFIDHFDSIFDSYLKEQDYNYIIHINPMEDENHPNLSYCVTQENDNSKDFEIYSNIDDRPTYSSFIALRYNDIVSRSYCYTKAAFLNGKYDDFDYVISLLESESFSTGGLFKIHTRELNSNVKNSNLYGKDVVNHALAYQIIYKSNIELTLHAFSDDSFYPLKFNNSEKKYYVGDRFFTYEDIMLKEALYELKINEEMDNISDFSITALGTLKNDLEFKIEYIPDDSNQLLNISELQFYTRYYEDNYIKRDSSFSNGLTLNDFALENGKQVWYGTIHHDLIYQDDEVPISDYRWTFKIVNLDNLHGTLRVYAKTVPNYGFVTSPRSLNNLYRYDIWNGKDILVSPTGTPYTLYIPGQFFVQMNLWKYDIEIKAYDRKILATELNDDFYYVVPIDFVNNDYLRILAEIDFYTIYATAPELYFEPVIDNKVDIFIPGEGLVNKDIGGSGVDPGKDENSIKYFINMIKNAFEHFKEMLKTIFKLITKMYNSCPLNYRYYVTAAFLIFVVFVIMHFI